MTAISPQPPADVTLHVPRLKGVSFEATIIERYRRRESSVEEALIEMYLAGVSVRREEDITEALWGSRVSPDAIEDGLEGTLTYCDFPREHWTHICTNNMIERLNRKIRRRTRVGRCFLTGTLP